MLLPLIFARIIKTGSLTYIDPKGRHYHFGDNAAEPGIVVRVHDRATEWRLALNAEAEAGEAYMAGRLTIERGTLYDFLDLVMRNIGTAPLPFHSLAHGFRRLLKWWHQWNDADASKRRVQHHYDLDGRLYDLFLDTDKQYSCAYFPTPETTLEQAQIAKKRHIAAKLQLKAGQRVLDIGSGWGGMAIYLAQNYGVEVLGVTLSEEQHKIATQRARDLGLADKVKFEIRDYRSLEGPFDRIVSVGMFEHVGVPHFSAFFQTVNRLLAPDGVALLHAIGRSDGPGATAGFIRKYIFPGGYCPALSEVLPVIEKSGLYLTDAEILRLHYAETLKHWRQRFLAQWDKAKALYDERFCRMWEFYLAGSEVTFRHGGHMVFQLQMTRSVDTLPITRDYMLDEERAMAGNGKPAVSPVAARSA
ncbi:MAG: class I SAM-dependent methyltransferase [Ferrovibrio sp.]|jgi:cyclopropane-fatty-acyl-phospholipid synthase|nr:class I SAM-dependent methyltransferase [Ferrovibrio sp.]